MVVDNKPTKVRMVRGRPLRDTDPMPYRKGSASRIRETIRDAMLPEDTVAAMSGTPAERREDEAAAADRKRVERLLGEGGRTISDADRQLLMKKYINRNDGGIARKTRVF